MGLVPEATSGTQTSRRTCTASGVELVAELKIFSLEALKKMAGPRGWVHSGFPAPDLGELMRMPKVLPPYKDWRELCEC